MNLIEALNCNSEYTLAEIRVCLKTEAKRVVDDRTLRRWRYRLGIESSEHGTYTEKQVDALVSLASWTSTGRKIDHFIDVHYEILRSINVKQK